MDWLQLLLFGFILLYLLMKVIQTKSLKTTMILITGVLVIGCKLFLQQLDSVHLAPTVGKFNIHFMFN